MAGLTSREEFAPPGYKTVVWTFTLTEADARAWSRERIDMVEDAIWLLAQAIEGHDAGPLTLPRSGIQVR